MSLADEIGITFHAQRERSVALRREAVIKRKERLQRLKRWISENREEIRKAAGADLGKHPLEADISEVQTVNFEIKHTLKHLHRWIRPRRVDPTIITLGSKSSVIYEPKGVSLIIAPWNFPFNLGVGPLVHALAAGNTAIIKPSEQAPNTAALISRMVKELFPSDLVAVYEGGVDIAQELLKLPFDHIFFTGSPRVGKIVMEAASKHLTDVTLELGGKTPTVVDQSANLIDAARKVAWGKLLNAGQACIAPDYLLVHRKVKSTFLKLLTQELEKMYSDQGSFQKGSALGRMINQKHLSHQLDMLKDAKEKGATLVYGGESDPEDRFMGPTLVENVTSEMKIMQEEIFGPLLPICEFENVQEVVDMVNSRPKPLGIYVFSRDSNFTKELTLSTSSGGVVVNDTFIQFGHQEVPFGGIGNSGLGKAHGFYGFRAFSHEKPVIRQRAGSTLLRLVYPPYNGFKSWVLDVLHKYV